MSVNGLEKLAPGGYVPLPPPGAPKPEPYYKPAPFGERRRWWKRRTDSTGAR